MADIVASEGYANVGYEYINVDDCWLEKERNQYGELVADRTRFPRGMKSLADYVSTVRAIIVGSFYIAENELEQEKLSTPQIPPGAFQRSEVWDLRGFRQLHLRWIPWCDP